MSNSRDNLEMEIADLERQIHNAENLADSARELGYVDQALLEGGHAAYLRNQLEQAQSELDQLAQEPRQPDLYPYNEQQVQFMLDYQRQLHQKLAEAAAELTAAGWGQPDQDRQDTGLCVLCGVRDAGHYTLCVWCVAEAEVSNR